MKLITKLITADRPKAVQTPTNRIMVVDVSGSMYSELAKLRLHLKNNLVSMIQPQDSLTLMWFSGRGQFGTIFEDVQISTVTDLAKIHTAIDRYLVAQGLTGFLDPIKAIRDVISRGTKDNYTLSFMTDGYDNQWSKKQILDACSELGDSLSSIAYIEYGYYADHDMLMQMAEASGGDVVMAEDFDSYADNLTTQMAGKSGKRLTVEVPDDFTPSMKYIVATTPNGFAVSVPKNGKASLPCDAVAYTYATSTGKITSVEDRLNSVAYVAALIQSGQADTAVDVATAIGDRGLFNKIENSFSKQDYSRAIDHCNNILAGKIVLGKKENLKVSPNAYNVLTMLMDLSEEGNYLHLSHPEFSYTRGGAKTIADESSDEFVSKFSDLTDDVKAPISALKFDEDRPNISILVRREGTATLPDNDYGFGNSIQTFIWRNYTIVRDGIVNVKKLPVILTKKTHSVLAAEGVITEPFKVGQTYVIDTTKYPVINRKMATVIDSTSFFKKQFEMYKLQAEQKYVKTFIDKSEVSPGFVDKYGEEAAKFLKQYGIGEGGFSPVGGKKIENDPYIAKVLEVKMSGLSGIPKVADVTKALADKKNLTPSQKVLADVITKYGELTSEKATESFKLIKAELAAARNDLIMAKFGIILGRKWFTDKTDLDDNSTEIDFGLGKMIKCQAILAEKEV